MWALCMFDLPVKTQQQRKAAHDFRMHLLDLGFGLAQYSVYMRVCGGGKEELDTVAQKVEFAVPPAGKVYILWFTDKQFENILRFHNSKKQPQQKNPQQLLLL